MRNAALIVVAGLLISAGPPQEKAKHEGEASAKRVKELENERIAALRSAAEVSTRLALNARIDPEDAIEDRIALLGAELEAAETKVERVALYKKTVEAMKELEELAKARMQAARGTELSVHRIKARRLQVEIQLERAKIKEAE